MVISLAALQPPEGIEASEDFVTEFDAEEQKTYEMWMLETHLLFDDAAARLSAFVRDHFGGRESVSFAEVSGFRSWAATWACGEQEISTQLTGSDGSSSGYLRNAYGIR